MKSTVRDRHIKMYKDNLTNRYINLTSTKIMREHNCRIGGEMVRADWLTRFPKSSNKTKEKNSEI